MLVMGNWSAGRVGVEVMQRSQRGMTPAPYIRDHLTLVEGGQAGDGHLESASA